MPLLYLFAIGGWKLWIIYIQTNYAKKVKQILLAVDVPRENEQGPESVERMFSQLTGAGKKGNKIERFVHGFHRPTFSFEIVSVDGQIRYFIRTPVVFRDMIEAAVYTAYPDAEIKEAEDYVKPVPDKFPDKEYDLWAADMVLYKDQAYPIRTYVSFEHLLTQELKDPLVPLLETMSKLQPGEQIWIQLLVKPTDNNWKDKGKKEVDKLMGKKEKAKKTELDAIVDVLGQAGDLIGMGGGETRPEKSEDGSSAALLSPGERRVVDSIQKKIAKIGFDCKLRVAYVGKKEVFAKNRGVIGILGAIGQFSTLDMNGFVPDSRVKTSEPFFWTKKRLAAKQNKLIKSYKGRSTWQGAKTYVLNTEELASLYHLPLATEKAPLIKTTGSKRGEPPIDLPVA